MIEQRWPTQDEPFPIWQTFLSQTNYYVLLNSCHYHHFCSTLFLQLLLLQLLVAFNKTNVHKMFLNISITMFVSFFHSHQFVFAMVWFQSCRLFLDQKLWGVLIPNVIFKQSALIGWVGPSVDLCCTFARNFLHK